MIKSILYFLNQYSDAITAVSAIVVATAAIYGIREWKRQIIGKTDYEIARRLLRSSLKLRDAMQTVRNPFISTGEMTDAMTKEGIELDLQRDMDRANRAVYSVRWQRVQAAGSEMEADLLEAEVSWGADAPNAAQKLRDLSFELLFRVQDFVAGRHSEKLDEVLYNTGTAEKPDPFTQKINEAVNCIRDYLKPHLK